MLKKLSIQYFKGFFEEQNIDFAVPSNDKTGSGLTLIVGPNNTGKTTIIESLLLNEEKKFKESERHKSNQPLITIENDSVKSIFSNISKGSQVQLINGSKPHNIKFELIPSRRFWNHYSGSDWDMNTFLDQTRKQEIRNAGSIDTAAMLKRINHESEQKIKFNETMKQIIPHFTDWTIDTNDQGDYVKYMTATSEHQANFLGDGIISIFRICAHLLNEDKNGVLVIDEPELSLHPSAQKTLASILSKASKYKQIILCTHSPYFANWEDFINGAKFVRLNKIGDKKCTVSILDNDKKYGDFIESNFNEWQKPQILDIVAKEILFSEKILFTEGQEDVGLIRKWANENSKYLFFDLFGYGVGSYVNMKLFLELARDLGLEKVAALYDNGENERRAIKEDGKNYPNYHLIQLTTEDIRDKYKECKECGGKKQVKEGCFDEHGVLKEKYKSDFEKKLGSIIEYFES